MINSTGLGNSQSALRAILGTDEKVLWSGRPLGGIRLHPSDLIVIPFSLMWGGFAIFWEATVIASGAPWFFKLWGIPFVLMGLYMIFGRFIYDAWRRDHSTYAITDRRVVIIENGNVQSLPLKALPNVSVRDGADGIGTISLSSTSSPMASVRAWPGPRPGPALELIPAAAQVYRLLTDAVHAA